jgi:3D (Asp-Asp-Asp) domain-containing protein
MKNIQSLAAAVLVLLGVSVSGTASAAMFLLDSGIKTMTTTVSFHMDENLSDAGVPVKDVTTTIVPEAAKAQERVKRTITVLSTAYSSEAAQTDDTPCIPAMHKFDLCKNYEETGVADTIAANFLPLGTKVRIPELYGDKVLTVRDRMNSRYNVDKIGYYRIDVWLPEKSEAITFGVKRGLTMEILQ